MVEPDKIADIDRYNRQMILPEVGFEGQQKLRDANVLVVGCGGLGSPVLQYLVGAGVGHITIVDADLVERNNLHRQPLFNQNDVGNFKVVAAQKHLSSLNSGVEITAVNLKLCPSNAKEFIKANDVVLDCTDSLAAAYVLSDVCFEQAVPLIHASASQLKGYVGGFCAGMPSLRAVFPDMPASAANCAQAGVLGSVVGTIGLLQAQITLLTLLNTKPSALGRLFNFDGLKLNFTSIDFSQAKEPEQMPLRFIDQNMIDINDFVIELRDQREAPQPICQTAKRISIDEINHARIVPEFDNILQQGNRVVFCCQSGIRAWRAARLIDDYYSGELVLIAVNCMSS